VPISRRCSTSSRTLGRWGSDDQLWPCLQSAHPRARSSRGLGARPRGSHTVTMSLAAQPRGPSAAKPSARRTPDDVARGRRARRRAAPVPQGLRGRPTTTNDGPTRTSTALSHVAYRGALYNDRPEGSVTAGGAGWGAIEVLRDGLVGRGRPPAQTSLVPEEWSGSSRAETRLRRRSRKRRSARRWVAVRDGDIPARCGPVHARRLAAARGRGNTPEAKAGLHTRRRVRFVGGRSRRRQSSGPTANSYTGSELDGGGRLPDPRARDHRDGRSTCSTICVRGSPVRLRTRKSAGSSCSPRLRCGVLGGTGSPINPVGGAVIRSAGNDPPGRFVRRFPCGSAGGARTNPGRTESPNLRATVRIQTRELLFDGGAVLGQHLVVQLFEHRPHAAHHTWIAAAAVLRISVVPSAR